MKEILVALLVVFSFIALMGQLSDYAASVVATSIIIMMLGAMFYSLNKETIEVWQQGDRKRALQLFLFRTAFFIIILLPFWFYLQGLPEDPNIPKDVF